MAEAKTFDLKGRHLVIGMPAYTGVYPVEFQESLIETLAACRGYGIKTTLASRCGSALIDKTRDEIVHGFLTRTNGTDLLMIDSDIVWQPDDVLRLMGWATTRDFVVGPYCTKQDDPSFYYDLMPTKTGRVWQDEDGLLAVKSAPGGFNLMRRSMLEAMMRCYSDLQYQAHRGEFKGETVTALHMMYLKDMPDGTRHRIGEDIALCNRWRRIGGSIWMDPVISLGHIGKQVYRRDYGDWLISRQPAQMIEPEQVRSVDLTEPPLVTAVGMHT